MNNSFAYTTQNIYARLQTLSSCTKAITKSQTNPPTYPVWLSYYSMYLNPLSIYSPSPTDLSIFWWNYNLREQQTTMRNHIDEIQTRILELKKAKADPRKKG